MYINNDPTLQNSKVQSHCNNTITMFYILYKNILSQISVFSARYPEQYFVHIYSIQFHACCTPSISQYTQGPKNFWFPCQSIHNFPVLFSGPQCHVLEEKLVHVIDSYDGKQLGNACWNQLEIKIIVFLCLIKKPFFTLKIRIQLRIQLFWWMSIVLDIWYNKLVHIQTKKSFLFQNKLWTLPQ
jgi:hypothetical protein